MKDKSKSRNKNPETIFCEHESIWCVGVYIHEEKMGQYKQTKKKYARERKSRAGREKDPDFEKTRRRGEKEASWVVW